MACSGGTSYHILCRAQVCGNLSRGWISIVTCEWTFFASMKCFPVAANTRFGELSKKSSNPISWALKNTRSLYCTTADTKFPLGMTRNLTSFMLISARLLESIRLTFGRSARKGQFQRMFRLRVAFVHQATKQLAPWPFGLHPHALRRSWSARSAYSDFRVTT